MRFFHKTLAVPFIYGVLCTLALSQAQETDNSKIIIEEGPNIPRQTAPFRTSRSLSQPPPPISRNDLFEPEFKRNSKSFKKLPLAAFSEDSILLKKNKKEYIDNFVSGIQSAEEYDNLKNNRHLTE